jgi:replicative DNA helicase
VEKKPDKEKAPATLVDRFETSKDLIRELFRRFDNLSGRPKEGEFAVYGITTGFAPLDRITYGLQKGSLTVVTAQSGIGKSIFVYNMARLVTVKGHVSVVLFTPEMPQEQVMVQICAAEAKMQTYRMQRGDIYELEWFKLVRASGDLSEVNLFLDDVSPLPLERIAEIAGNLNSETKLDLIIIDGLNDLRLGDKYSPLANRELLTALKRLARELDVAVVITAPLNNIVLEHNAVVTELSSFDPEVVNVADLIIILDRNTETAPRDGQGELDLCGKLTVSVLKNRCGQTGQVSLNLWREAMLAYCIDEKPPKIKSDENE